MKPAGGVLVDERPCQRCFQKNPNWHAKNELWNAIIPNRVGVLCPTCFIEIAESQGIHPTAWVLDVEHVRVVEEAEGGK